jgi:glutamate carboxypeptidase
MHLEDLLPKTKSYLPQMLAVLEQLVNHESPSDDKPTLDSYARKLSARFDALGAETRVIASPTAGDHLQVDLPAAGGKPEQPGLLLCHYDTVWPTGTIGERPFRISGDKAYGPGVYDMKASHVMLEFALRGISDLGLRQSRPLTILFNSDEEIGSRSSRALIEEHARRSEYVLVLEPPTAEGALKTARKGVGGFNLKVKGRASHAGSQPELGISAINELARQVLLLQELADVEKGTTVNVGIIEGGTRSNVIAAQATARIDLRAWTSEETERLKRAIREMKPVLPGAELDISGGFGRPPMVRSQVVVDLYQKAQKVGKKLGLDLKEGSTGGGSDGNFTAALGVPTLDGLGAMGDGAHADHEHILISRLAERTALLAALMLEL